MERQELKVLHLLDKVGVEFEATWKPGGQQQIKDFLDHAAENLKIKDLLDFAADNPTVRDALLRHLIPIELEMRRKPGEASPTIDEYKREFPNLAEWLLDHFDRAAFSDSPSPERTVLQARPEWPEVPDYEIRNELGRGSMGVVYLAFHRTLQREDAIKTILAGRLAADGIDRFLTEARAIAQLRDHRNIVQIYTAGEYKGQHYYSMEYVKGGKTLADHLKDRRSNCNQWREPEAVEVVEILARTMHFVHGNGIIHRDLKPGNVLIAPDGTVKIADFGIAMRLNAGNIETADGMILGTPAYMAPEQANGRNDQIGAWTDVYSLGVILYEMLTGQLPFQGEDWRAILNRVCEEAPQAPTQHRPELDPKLEAICLKCLKKTSAERYKTADAFAAALRRWAVERAMVRWVIELRGTIGEEVQIKGLIEELEQLLLAPDLKMTRVER